MRYLLPFISLLLFSCGNTIYIVRHAEKETGIDMATMKPSSDPPLSPAGQERALQLKQVLGSEHIKHIYSTNTLRTVSTATPLKELYPGMPIHIYSSRMDSMDAFIRRIKEIRKDNVLIVGHSNTVDDLANKIAGSAVVPGDLKDSEYDNLFILKRKGNSYQFKKDKYGVPSK
jgi:broad specificity phosphatase PhoE